MAIQRCPYCKAIIDEGAEYCTNCGTKLLFPEDDFVEEEVPGEKLIDLDDDMGDDTEDEQRDLDLESPVDDEEESDTERSLSGDIEEGDVEEVVEADEVPAQEFDSAEEELEQEEPEESTSGQEKSSSWRRRRRSKKKAASKKEKEETPVEIIDDLSPEEAGEASDEIMEEEAAGAAGPGFEESELTPEAETGTAFEHEGEREADREVEPDYGTKIEPDAEHDIRDALEPESEPQAEPEAEDKIKVEEPIEQDEWNITGQEAGEDIDQEETRHGLTDDLPDHFAQALDEARARAGEPLDAPPAPLVEEEPEELVEEKGPEEGGEEALEPEPGTAEEKEWQTPPPVDDEVGPKPDSEEVEAIQTDDIEEIVDEAEKEKEEIDAFIASVRQERQAIRAQTPVDTQDVPPWVESVEKGPLPDIPPTDEIESRQQETEDADERVLGITPPSEEIRQGPATPGYDTRSAFPETVDQQGLPFVPGTQEFEKHDGTVEESVTEEEPARELKPKRRKTQNLGFVDWIKARVFDVLFVAALWFVAMWIASQVLEASVFRIIIGAIPLALAFLALLLFIYFFFFLFFLGETLGNYLFVSDD